MMGQARGCFVAVSFPVQSFNEETRSVLRKSEHGLEVARFDSAEALFEDLGI